MLIFLNTIILIGTIVMFVSLLLSYKLLYHRAFQMFFIASILAVIFSTLRLFSLSTELVIRLLGTIFWIILSSGAVVLYFETRYVLKKSLLKKVTNYLRGK